MALSAAPTEQNDSTEFLLQELHKQLAADRQAFSPSAVSEKLWKACMSWEIKHRIGPTVLIVLLIAVPSVLIYNNEEASFAVMSHLRLALTMSILPAAERIGLPAEFCLIGNPMHQPKYALNMPEDCKNCASLDRVIRIREGPFEPADFVRDLIDTKQPAVIDARAAGQIPLFSASSGNASLAELAAFYAELPPLEPETDEKAALLAASADGVCDMRHTLAKSRPDLNSPSRLLGAGLESGWAASWRNCHADVVKGFRRYLSRPDCVPMSASFQHSHLLVWNSHPGHEFMPLPARPEPNLLLLHQVKGTARIELSPREPCRDQCPSLDTVLRPGQLLAVSNWYYRLAWLPVTMGEGFAVALEASTVNAY